MRSVALIRVGVATAALAVGVAACSSSPGHPSSSATGGPPQPSGPAAGSSPTAAAALTNTPAAQLYAALDQLLHEHVDLTINVVQTAITKGPGSADTRAALAALDQDTQGLGAAIGAVYGPAAQQQFLKLWRAHIGFFVDYTLGEATHDAGMVATAQRDLAGYISQFSQFVATATHLPVAAVAADLQGHVTTLEAAIDAVVSRSPNAGGTVAMAAMHMDGTAQVLARGIASSKGISGAVTGAGASLRAALTGLLVQHVAATGFVVQAAVAAGGNLQAPEVQGAVAALDDNTDALGAAIGAVYGPAAQQQFLKLWRAHIGFFVDYTLGEATHDAGMVATAQRDLAGYISQFSQFVATATHLPVAAVAADLQGHVTTLEAAINAIVSGATAEGGDLLMAEDHMAGTAAVLAAGIASSMPARFTS